MSIHYLTKKLQVLGLQLFSNFSFHERGNMVPMSMEFIEALQEIAKEKGISQEVLLDAIEAALISSYKRNFNTAQNVRVEINRHNGVIKVYARKTVVEDVLDSRLEISVDSAREVNPHYQVDDVAEIEVT